MNTYTKVCSFSEVELTIKAHNIEIGPPVINYKPVDSSNPKGSYLLKTLILGKTLYDTLKKSREPERLSKVTGKDHISIKDLYSEYQEGILKAYEKLHSIGIIHGDPSEENIVIQKEPKEGFPLPWNGLPYRVWIIDYGFSVLAEDINIIKPIEKITIYEEIVDLYGIEYSPKNIKELFVAEIHLLIFLNIPTTYPEQIKLLRGN